MHGLSTLNQILASGAIRVVFQPIFRIAQGSRRVQALEALVSGPEGTNVAAPEQAESIVDRACVNAILEAVRGLPGDVPCAINLHVATLAQDHEFVSFLRDAAGAKRISPSRLTVEIVESASRWGARYLFEALRELRAMGVGIALDNFGIGNSGARMILGCNPDWIKVDGHLVRGACTDIHRQARLRSVARMARDIGANVVAEGLEQDADLDIVQELGIKFVQGYLLCPPLEIADLEERGVFGNAVTRNDRGRRMTCA
jgi:EAL domain-containing protein (putative c-di-GMP-specific phosphodiesterase class I)